MAPQPQEGSGCEPGGPWAFPGCGRPNCGDAAPDPRGWRVYPAADVQSHPRRARAPSSAGPGRARRLGHIKPGPLPNTTQQAYGASNSLCAYTQGQWCKHFILDLITPMSIEVFSTA